MGLVFVNVLLRPLKTTGEREGKRNCLDNICSEEFSTGCFKLTCLKKDIVQVAVASGQTFKRPSKLVHATSYKFLLLTCLKKYNNLCTPCGEITWFILQMNCHQGRKKRNISKIRRWLFYDCRAKRIPRDLHFWHRIQEEGEEAKNAVLFCSSRKNNWFLGTLHIVTFFGTLSKMSKFSRGQKDDFIFYGQIHNRGIQSRRKWNVYFLACEKCGCLVGFIQLIFPKIKKKTIY